MAEFAGYLQMELLLNLLDQLPHFYQTVLYNVVHHLEKVTCISVFNCNPVFFSPNKMRCKTFFGETAYNYVTYM